MMYDSVHGVLEVDVVGEIHVDGVSDNVEVLGRVDSCEVIVIDKDGAVRRG